MKPRLKYEFEYYEWVRKMEKSGIPEFYWDEERFNKPQLKWPVEREEYDKTIENPPMYDYVIETLKGKIPSNKSTHTLTLPEELDADNARAYFTRAVEVGYMKPNGTTAQWLSAVARLGYMCYKIYSQPRPIASLERYFGVTKLSASITQASYEAKRADVKKWRAEIDENIFFD